VTPKIRSKPTQVMKRIFTAFALCTMLFALCFPASAQQPKKIPRIGFLSIGSPSSVTSRYEAFRQGLRELGYVEGQNILIEWRFAEGKREELPALASDLVHLKVDVIVTAGTTATTPAKRATSTIPIVMAYSADPVGTGLVASLSRPGGNVTGLTEISPDLAGKRLELIREAVPRATRVAVLWDGSRPANIDVLKEIDAAARAYGVRVQSLEVRSSKDFESAFRAATQQRARALIIPSGSLSNLHAPQVVSLALRSRLPSIWETKNYVDIGGLMSYGPSLDDLYRRAAVYVDKILKGTKPADLPVEQPTKFEFVINLKTAKQIGLTIPQSVLYRADKVIR
jgi:putative tryptophan/tyrosine transport system substrate-binding protein